MVALPKDYRLEEYVIERVLGQGGFGITYQAVDTRLDARVAIKEYFPQSIAGRTRQFTIMPRSEGQQDYQWGLNAFLEEARALAKFKHDNIVRVLRFVEANGTAYMVMEYEEGEPLSAYLKRSGGYLNEQMLLAIFLPVLSGLQAVHNAGLLHLDIKPDNIYLRRDGRPMLIDFGSARQHKSGAGEHERVALTPAYSAIEQYPGKGKTGPWSDVYAMGATLYRCVVGKAPTDSHARYQALRAKKVDPYESAAQFNHPRYAAHIREIIDHALKLDPRARPQSAILLQKGLMGQRIDNPDMPVKQITQLSNFKADLLKVGANRDAGEGVYPAERSRFEKFIIGLVLCVAIPVFTTELLIQLKLVERDTVMRHIAWIHGGMASRIDASIDKVDSALYERWRLRIKQPETQSQPTTSAQPRPDVPMVAAFTPDKKLVHTLKHEGAITSIAFMQKMRLVAAADQTGLVRIWEIETAKLLLEFPAKARQPIYIASGPDGRLLARSNGAIALMWSSDKNKDLMHYANVKEVGTIRQLAISPDGRLLVAVRDTKVIDAWELDSGKHLYTIRGFKKDITAITFSKNARFLASADAAGDIRIWSATDGKEISHLTLKQPNTRVTALAYSADGVYLASAGPEGELKLWAIGSESQQDQVMLPVQSGIEHLHFTHDAKWLLGADTKGMVRLWQLDSEAEPLAIDSGHGHMRVMRLSEDGSWLATGGDDRQLRLWK